MRKCRKPIRIECHRACLRSAVIETALELSFQITLIACWAIKKILTPSPWTWPTCIRMPCRSRELINLMEVVVDNSKTCSSYRTSPAISIKLQKQLSKKNFKSFKGCLKSTVKHLRKSQSSKTLPFSSCRWSLRTISTRTPRIPMIMILTLLA